MRFGKKHYPTYRIVALDKRKKRDGSYIEKVGTYNPMTEPVQVEINQERFNYWKMNGAEISEGLRKLLKKITPAAPVEKKAAPKAKEAKEEKAAPKKKATAKKAAK